MDEPKKLETLLKTIGKDLTVLDIAKDISNGVTQLTFGQKPFPPLEPVRAESPAVAHEFNDIEGFIAYLEQYGVSDAVVVLASVKQECIHATLDEKEVDGRQKICFRPQVHPLLVPWLGILNKAIPVKDFAQFLMQRRRAVVDPDGRELALMLSQVRAESTFTLHVGTGKSALNGLLVKTKIDGELKSVPIELPEVLTIEVPLYLNTDPARIELDLLITSPNPETVVVTVSAADLEERKLAAFMQMLDEVKTELTDAVTSLGTLQYRDWEYLGK